MVSHSLNLCSAFNPSKCTHTTASGEHTQSSGQLFFAVAPRDELWVHCIAQGSHLVVLKVKALVIHSPHLQSILVPRLEPKSNSLTIRTQLAPSYWRANVLHSLAPTSSNTLALTFLVILNQGRCQGEAFAGPAPLPFL